MIKQYMINTTVEAVFYDGTNEKEVEDFGWKGPLVPYHYYAKRPDGGISAFEKWRFELMYHEVEQQ